MKRELYQFEEGQRPAKRKIKLPYMCRSTFPETDGKSLLSIDFTDYACKNQENITFEDENSTVQVHDKVFKACVMPNVNFTGKHQHYPWNWKLSMEKLVLFVYSTPEQRKKIQHESLTDMLDFIGKLGAPIVKEWFIYVIKHRGGCRHQETFVKYVEKAKALGLDDVVGALVEAQIKGKFEIMDLTKLIIDQIEAQNYDILQTALEYALKNKNQQILKALEKVQGSGVDKKNQEDFSQSRIQDCKETKRFRFVNLVI